MLFWRVVHCGRGDLVLACFYGASPQWISRKEDSDSAFGRTCVDVCIGVILNVSQVAEMVWCTSATGSAERPQTLQRSTRTRLSQNLSKDAIMGYKDHPTALVKFKARWWNPIEAGKKVVENLSLGT
jgi:hypothetical protein